MIVNYTKEGWEVITQRAHGLLAAQIASHWKHDIRNQRWLETLVAIADHDDAQVELERDDLLTPQGGPVDFKMRTFDLDHSMRTMNLALSKSRYVALLCSMHLDFLYDPRTNSDKAAFNFIKEQRTLQQQWCKEINITTKDAELTYWLLQWCDALSLLLCQHDNQPEGRSIEISKGADNVTYVLIQLNDGKLSVEPWPFEEKRFEVYLERRLIPQLQFNDSEDFKQAFRNAKITDKRWCLQKRN